MISYDELSLAQLGSQFARGRLSLSRINALGVARLARRTPEQLVATLRAHTRPRGLPAAFGGRIALLDGMTHHQDVRRPLGKPREIPRERLLRALPFARIARRSVPSGVRGDCGCWPPISAGRPGAAPRSAVRARRCCWRSPAAGRLWTSCPATACRCLPGGCPGRK
ncbi:hypothetical protein [Amycolatopsis acidicola]|uniref:hypothetical protein n=1 Tax=Amycolatopsis acidicola TaxID=2596893 RepID=UPI001AA056C3|nr:hypothetical protein [Amycolatopsis acidicola]